MTLQDAVHLLKDAGIEEAHAEVRMLFRSFTDAKDADLYGGNPDSSSPVLIDAVRRRAAREPIAYILGECAFYRETYFVSPDVLIPRPETELLVDYAVKHLPEGARFADICTGSGCVGLSVLKNTTDTEAVLTDLSEQALRIAKKNAEALAVSPRAVLLQSNALTDRIDGLFDAVLSNPPYVKDDVYLTLEKEIFHEPKMAFVGGRDGMDFYRAIVEHYRYSLKENGFFAFEIGYDQADDIHAVGEAAGFCVTVYNDLSGLARLAVLQPLS